MSMKTVCDRCGSIMNDNQGYYLYFYTNAQVSKQFFRYGPNEGHYDLCDRCYSEVRNFLDNRQYK